MKGILNVVGVGPGDPELMTVKAARIIRGAAVVAYFCKKGRTGHARGIAAGLISPAAQEIRLEYPFTTEIGLHDQRYLPEMAHFYDTASADLATILDTGRDITLLCEGDPFFYGSSMHLFDRLHGRYRSEIVPGVTGMSGCWTRARLPMTHGDDVLSVMPGTLELDEMTTRLRDSDAAVIMKVGGNLAKIRMALDAAGVARRAVYVEAGTMSQERVVGFERVEGDRAPYFSLVLVPGRQAAR